MYLVHTLKSHIVHLTTKTIVTKGAESLLRPWQLPFPPARGTKTLSCPRQLLSFSVDSPAVDQVHFQVPYQVHRMCPRGASEAGLVYQVHPLKSDLVLLTRKETSARGTEPPLCPWQLLSRLPKGLRAETKR